MAQQETSIEETPGWRPLTRRDIHRLAAELDSTADPLEKASPGNETPNVVDKLGWDIVCLWRRLDCDGAQEDLPTWDRKVQCELHKAFREWNILAELDCVYAWRPVAPMFRRRAQRLRRLAEAPDARKPKDSGLGREEILAKADELRALASIVWPEAIYHDTPGWAVLLAWDLSDWPALLNAEDDLQLVAAVEEAELLLYEVARQRTPPDIEEKLTLLVNEIEEMALTRQVNSQAPAAQTAQVGSSRRSQTEPEDRSDGQTMKIDLNDLRHSKQRRQLIRLLDDEDRAGIEADPVLVRRLRCTLRAKARALKKPSYAQLANAIVEVKGRTGFRKLSVPAEHIKIIRPR